MVVILAVAIFCSATLLGCGGSDCNPTPRAISTDATVNKSLLTSFTGPTSATVSGTWTNPTYASTGDVTADVAFNTTTNIVTINFDIDGNVYGGTDPAPETFLLDMTNFINNGTSILTFTSAIYGDVTAAITFYTDNTGEFSGSATNAPNPAVTNAGFSGTFEISGSAVTFTIDTAQFTIGGVNVTCTQNLTTVIN